MKRSDIVPENYEMIYDEFAHFEVNQRIQNLGFGVMHAAFKSEVHYEGRAEETITEHTQRGGSVILAPNHQSNSDTPTIAGIVYEEPFKPLRGNTMIPAKAELFRNPITGRIIPHMMAHPAFRSKDFASYDQPEELRTQVRAALLQLNIDHIDSGGSIALFTESTRNKSDPRKVQPIRRGIADIARNVNDPDTILIVPLGICYRTIVGKALKLRPFVVVPEPFSPLCMTRDQILVETHSRIQAATTGAFDITEFKRKRSV